MVKDNSFENFFGFFCLRHNLCEDVKNKVMESVGEKLNLKLFKEQRKLKFLGFGSFGCAYSFKDKVLKITEDPKEIALSKKMVGRKNNYLADIYSINEFKNDLAIIVLEKLETKTANVQRTIGLINFIIKRQGVFTDFNDLVKEDLEDIISVSNSSLLGMKCTSLCLDLIMSAYKCKEELSLIKGYDDNNDDISLSNMGVKGKKGFAFFDQR